MNRNVFFLSLLMVAFSNAAAHAAELPSITVAEDTVARERVLDGVVEAVDEATISAQTSGQVAEVLYDVEDLVEKDAIIVRLRDTEQRAALNKAEADLAAAKARLAEAEAAFKRQDELASRDLVSKSALDKARAAMKTTQAQVKAAAAGIERQREQLEYTVIRAPYTGIVTKKLVNVGETVNPGTPIISGFSLARLRVRAEVPQRLIAPIRRIGQARVIDDSGRDYDVGNLTIFPFASAGSNSFTVRLDLEQASGDLFPGMLVKAAFVVGLDKRQVIPRQAVAYRGELTAVYVLEPDGGIVMRQVRLGHRIGEQRVEVLAGLSDGEQVALDPIGAGVVLREQMTRARNE